MISVLFERTPAKQSSEIYESTAWIWGDSVAVFQQIADVLYKATLWRYLRGSKQALKIQHGLSSAFHLITQEKIPLSIIKKKVNLSHNITLSS